MTSALHGLSGVLGGFNEKMADLTKWDPITSWQFKTAAKTDRWIHKKTKPPEAPKVPRTPEAPHMPDINARRSAGDSGGGGGLLNGTLLTSKKTSGGGRSLIGGG